MFSRMRAHTAILIPLTLILLLVATVALAHGPALPDVATVSGYLWYDGSISASAEVALFADLEQPPLFTVSPGAVPGPFTFASVPDGTYYLTAFLDVSNTGGPPEVGEPVGSYDPDFDGVPDPIVVSGGAVTALQIVISDVNCAYLITDVYPGASSSMYSAPYAVFQGITYFGANDGVHGTELWRSDGTAAGTTMVLDMNPAGSAMTSYLLGTSSWLYFWATDGGSQALWRSDGTAAGTEQVATVDHVYGPVASGDTIYFVADDPAYGTELWISDGTAAGTHMVVDLTAGADDTHFSEGEMVIHDGILYFAADAGQGEELWRSNGTAAGTWIVKDLYPGPVGSDPRYLTVMGNHIYFKAYTAASEDELWRSDGTTAGTTLLKEINPSGSSSPYALTVVENWLYFSATDGAHGVEPWRSDGTAAGTQMIADIESGGDSAPTGFAGMGGLVYFAAHQTGSGNELWRSDGTSGGTSLVADIEPGNSGSHPGYEDTQTALVSNGNLLYFSAYTSNFGRELWVSDGSEQGTTLLRDIAPGASSGSPIQPVLVGNRLFFSAEDSVHGREPWAVLLADDAINGLSLTGSDGVQLGQTAAFTATVGSGTNLLYTWDFGDGDSTYGPSATHVYGNPGKYRVMVTAQNAQGSSSKSKAIKVWQHVVIVPGGPPVVIGGGEITIKPPPDLPGTLNLYYAPQETPDYDPTPLLPGGLVFNLEATDANGDPVTTLTTPLTVTVSYDGTALPSGVPETNLGLYRYDEGSAAWTGLTTLQHDTGADTLLVSLDHFSQFALLLEPQSKLCLPLLRR